MLLVMRESGASRWRMDATDTASITAFGLARLAKFEVHADEVVGG